MQASSDTASNREFIEKIPEYLTRSGIHPEAIQGSFGVLLLHGFTSALDAVSGLIPTLESMKIPYSMPVLRGHNATPDKLIGVRAQDWYDDAYKALEELCQKVDHVFVIGLSMGGLVALNLCIKKHPCSDKIAACILWAPALGFVNPLAWLAKPLSIFFKNWKGQDSFHDPECRKNNHNYKTFPTKAFCELYDYAAETNKHLTEMLKPLCIIHSIKDQVVPIQTSRVLFEKASSNYREMHELTKSGHELGQDMEAETVFKLTAEFIQSFMPKAQA